MQLDSTASVAEPVPKAAGAPHPLVLDSRDLFRRHTQVLIRHGPDTYTLRMTRQGKLILTK
ncbi:MAG: hemin uptake protein HemP [Burkholderiaceae bacterium]